MNSIPINIIYEDELSGAVLHRLIESYAQKFQIGDSRCTRGRSWIHKHLGGLNNAAKGMPYLVLADLDQQECAPILIAEWLTVPKHPNLLFRIAVKEVESWILGCRKEFSDHIGIGEEFIPNQVDTIEETKEFLVSLVKRSKNRDLRNDIIPREGTSATKGPDYNGRLIYFVEKYWDPEEAKVHSPSLQRTIEVLDKFEPVWPEEE